MLWSLVPDRSDRRTRYSCYDTGATVQVPLLSLQGESPEFTRRGKELMFVDYPEDQRTRLYIIHIMRQRPIPDFRGTALVERPNPAVQTARRSSPTSVWR